MVDNQTIIAIDGEVVKTIFIPGKDDVADKTIKVDVGRSACVELTVLIMPGVTTSLGFDVHLSGEGADCKIYGVYLCPASEKVKINVSLNHDVPHCSSRQLFKGIVSGTAVADFSGIIQVAKDAQRTEAYQENHSLLLSDTAKVNTKPQLIIYADDVKCSHGATIGKLNEDEQFYMRSRGITLEEAKVLQMISFINPVLDMIDNQEDKERIAGEIETALRNTF